VIIVHSTNVYSNEHMLLHPKDLILILQRILEYPNIYLIFLNLKESLWISLSISMTY